VGSSPCVEIERVPEPPRQRHLDDHEIKAFWNKLETADATDYIKTGLKLLLVTGQRRGELAHAQWHHVDLVKGEWFLPHTKNGTTHRVPLSSLAVELLTSLKKQTRESKWVLPSPRVQPEDKPLIERALSRAVRHDAKHFELEHFTPYDLRRTFVTKLNALGTERATVESVVNHLAPKMERTYNNYDYWPEMVVAMELWGDELKRITEH
jgi:integrase